MGFTGAFPVGTVAITLCVDVSMIDTLSEPELLTYALSVHFSGALFGAPRSSVLKTVPASLSSSEAAPPATPAVFAFETPAFELAVGALLGELVSEFFGVGVDSPALLGPAVEPALLLVLEERGTSGATEAAASRFAALSPQLMATDSASATAQHASAV